MPLFFQAPRLCSGRQCLVLGLGLDACLQIQSLIFVGSFSSMPKALPGYHFAITFQYDNGPFSPTDLVNPKKWKAQWKPCCGVVEGVISTSTCQLVAVCGVSEVGVKPLEAVLHAAH